MGASGARPKTCKPSRTRMSLMSQRPVINAADDIPAFRANLAQQAAGRGLIADFRFEQGGTARIKIGRRGAIFLHQRFQRLGSTRETGGSERRGEVAQGQAERRRLPAGLPGSLTMKG